MRIGIITPSPPRSLNGNRVTALRWAKLLRSLGHRVLVAQRYGGQPLDVLIALHARRSYASIIRFHRLHPNRPLIVALTDSDLYHDLHHNRHAEHSVQLADQLIVLQPKALDELPPVLQKKTKVIYQSVILPNQLLSQIQTTQSSSQHFRVCVIGTLREVKDPFQAARATKYLPKNSRIQVIHAGEAESERVAVRAKRETHLNPRYRWLGEIAHNRVWRLLASSRLCLNSSTKEAGANVISEAIIAGVPIIASNVPGNVGLLGENYPGYFNVGDTRELARLLWRAETDSDFLIELKTYCRRIAGKFDPQREMQAWADLLKQLYS